MYEITYKFEWTILIFRNDRILQWFIKIMQKRWFIFEEKYSILIESKYKKLSTN
jgi:hypothetical protein